MKYFLGTSNFLEEISSLSHSIVFLYFFALITVLQSMGLQGVGHDWATSLSLSTFMHWRKKWQPTPVFLPGEFQERGSLVRCRLWGHTELDMTEAT